MTQFLPQLKQRDQFNLYIETHGIGKVEAKAVWEALKCPIKNIKELTDTIERLGLVSHQTCILLPGLGQGKPLCHRIV